jgi:small subunit ribosomal protein S7
MSSNYQQQKRIYGADHICKSILVHMVVNRIIRHEKKSLSYRLLYFVISEIRKKTHSAPLAILEHAIRKVAPSVQLKSRRVGGTNYQIPMRVGQRRGITLAIKWILISSRRRSGQTRIMNLSRELFEAAQGNGGSVRKREEVFRIAEANKAFARFRILPNVARYY